MNYYVHHWLGRGATEEIPGLKSDDKGRLYNYFTTGDVTALSKKYDVMLLEREGEHFIMLDVKGKRFATR